MNKLFKNFKDNEFKCPCCGKNPEMDLALMFILQTIRNKYGKPVNITSGYRCQEYNDTLKGSIKNSDHVKCKAADFYIKGVTNSVSKRLEIMQLVRYMPNFKYAYCAGWILYADGTLKEYKAD